ncbi:MAG: hypothetical protein DIU80_024555 [Chloroflexota bacterium]
MARREVRRWIAASPKSVFETLESHALSFAWLGETARGAATCARRACVGATATCPLRRGACWLCVTAIDPARLLALDVAHGSQTMRVRFSIEPQGSGTLLVCTTEYRGPETAPMPPMVSRIYSAFGRVPGEVKQLVEARQQP